MFWHTKVLITSDFFEKSATVNSSSFAKITLFNEWTLYYGKADVWII